MAKRNYALSDSYNSEYTTGGNNKVEMLIRSRTCRITFERYDPYYAEKTLVLEGEGIDEFTFCVHKHLDIFWSVPTPENPNRRTGVAIEGSEREKAGFDYDFDVGRFGFSPENIDDWRAISNAYAEQASGNVHVVLGDNVKEGSVWNTKELPALKANNNVHSIVTVDPSTGKNKGVLFENPNAICGPSVQDIPPIQPPQNYFSDPSGPDNFTSISQGISEAGNAVFNAADSAQNNAKSLTGGMV